MLRNITARNICQVLEFNKWNGSGGNASSIAQELAKDWTDSQGLTHPGIYDENNEYSVRWAESYPNAVAGTLKLVEPRKYRNDLFAAAKLLVPQGCIKFAPQAPRYSILVFDDGTERKLSKAEEASLIQMDLMKEEVCSMVRTKSATGVITYQLPPEKRNRMHDDRNYCFVLCCWEILNRRQESEFGDGVALNYDVFFGGNRESRGADKPWLDHMPHGVGNTGRVTSRLSPFQGSSPFTPK